MLRNLIDAGKTESTKLLVQHIVHQCQNQSTDLLQRIVKVSLCMQKIRPTVDSVNASSQNYLPCCHHARSCDERFICIGRGLDAVGCERVEREGDGIGVWGVGLRVKE